MNQDLALATVLHQASELSGIPIRPDMAEVTDRAPYIVYSEIALQEGSYTLQGESSLVPARYQIDVYGTTRVQTNVIATTVSSILIASFGAVVLNRQSFYEPETRLRRTMLDVSIWFDNV